MVSCAYRDVKLTMNVSKAAILATLNLLGIDRAIIFVRL